MMASKLTLVTDPKTSERMKRIRRAGTKPELIVRKWLWAQGIRYTVNNTDLPGSPDLANRSRKWAIFVHGCFWHGHDKCKLATLPKRNREFWRRKIDSNRLRDHKKEAQLAAMGYTVFTFWQCEVEGHPNSGIPVPSAVVSRLLRVPTRAPRQA
jgi:DNA mismatch endonuclease (patch repair protein)